MTSKQMRDDSLFVRNNFSSSGKWELATIKKQPISASSISLIACSDTKSNDTAINKEKGVHFFVDDYRFEGIYNNPERTLSRYSQYAFLLTPDFSLYADMPLWRQLENVAKNRWVGAYWQSQGLTVIPTISWSSPCSYDFCFDGIEEGSTVAISTLGCKQSKFGFMQGYNAMLKKIKPETIIVFDRPFSEMSGNIVFVDYHESRKVIRDGR